MRENLKYERLINLAKNANWLSQMTFWYILPLFRKGKTRDLNEKDLTFPLEEHKSANLGQKLLIIWNKEVEQAKKHKKSPHLTKVIMFCFWKEIIWHGFYMFFVEIFIRLLQPIFLCLLLRYVSSCKNIDTKNATIT